MAELLVVATPIGNLSDLSPRMADALCRCDLVAAEDTRVTMKLLSHLGISRPMVSCHRHNEDKVAPDLLRRMLEEDLVVALTSDAGTPAISDPGVALVRAAHEAGIKVTPISGPSAGIVALSASGFDAREFAFYGFLPREKKPLREKLRQLAMGPAVAVVYESPHRVVDLMDEVARQLPEARACVCCDLTKKFELILVGRADAVLEQMRANPNVEKGEYVVVLDLGGVPVAAPEAVKVSAEQAMLERMLNGEELNEAAAGVVELGMARNEVYRAKLRIKSRFGG